MSLVETKVANGNLPFICCTPPTHLFFNKNRVNSSFGGGIAVIINKQKFFKITELKLEANISSFEFLVITVTPTRNSKPVSIITIYRPPRANFAKFIQEFETLFHLVNSEKTIIVGDFNLHVDDELNREATSFTELLNTFNMQNHVNQSTYKNSDHFLDLIIDSYLNPLVNSVNVNRNICFSDHFCIDYQLNIDIKSKKETKQIEFRRFNDEAQQEKFNLSVKPKLDLLCTQNFNANALKLKFGNIVRPECDIYFPKINKEIMEESDKPWFNTECKISKRAFRKAERAHRKSKRHERAKNKVAYQTAFKNYVKTRRHAKKSYYHGLFDKYKYDSKKSYKVLASIMGKGTENTLPDIAATDPKTAANACSHTLDIKVRSIRATTESKNVPMKSITVARNYPIFKSFSPINMKQLDEIIKNVKKTYCCLDEIDFSKVDIDIFKPFFLKFINAVITECKFPKIEKCGIVRPLLKDIKLDKENWKNYRPICVNSYTHKLSQAALHDQLFEYVTVNDILPKYQSAYKPLHSCQSALTRVYSDIVTHIDQGRCVVLVLLDLSAAFDTIDHGLLVSDLFNMGVRGGALELIRDFLSGRDTRVTINGALSEPKGMLYGVPQGSVLGPLCFSLYITSLANVLEELGVKYHIFADDTQLYIDFDGNADINIIKNKLMNAFSKIDFWMNGRRLKLNIDKIHLIIFGPKSIHDKVIAEFDYLEYNGSKLYPSTQVRNLGVIFDSKLTFKPMVNDVIKRCNYGLHKVRHTKAFIPNNMLISVLHGEVFSKLDYCNILYLQLPKNELSRLQTIINKAVRIYFNLPPRHPTSEFLRRVHWLPMGPRIDYATLTMTHKAVVYGEPSYIKELLQYEENRQDKSRVGPKIKIPERGRYKFSERSFAISAPRLYMQLPPEIRRLTPEKFGPALKTFLFTEAYDHPLDSILKYNPSSGPYTYFV